MLFREVPSLSFAGLRPSLQGCRRLRKDRRPRTGSWLWLFPEPPILRFRPWSAATRGAAACDRLCLESLCLRLRFQHVSICPHFWISHESSRSCRSQASRIRHPHRRLLRRTLRTEGRPHTILHAVAPGGHDVTPHGGRKLPVQRTRFSCW